MVPGPDVPALVCQQRVELAVAQPVQGAGGDHQPGAGAGQRPGQRAGVLQHHQPLARAPPRGQARRELGGLPGQLPLPAAAQGAGQPDLGAQRLRRAHPAEGQQQRPGHGPGAVQRQPVGLGDPVRGAQEQHLRGLRPGGRSGEHHRQPEAEQHRHHQALPRQQRQHRLAFHPAGPGEHPGTEDSEQQAEHQQGRQDVQRVPPRAGPTARDSARPPNLCADGAPRQPIGAVVTQPTSPAFACCLAGVQIIYMLSNIANIPMPRTIRQASGSSGAPSSRRTTEPPPVPPPGTAVAPEGAAPTSRTPPTTT